MNEADVPQYIALSHTWLADSEEVKYDDIINGRASDKVKSDRKIHLCAQQALKDGVEHIWVDTCCFNRSNSQEVQEAVVGMYQLYKKAEKCYVYLSDLSTTGHDVRPEQISQALQDVFEKCRWFTRGWTLQELLAPRIVEFFSAEGVCIGDKASLQSCISRTTGIPSEALSGSKALTEYSVRKRLSWASQRKTTRREDKAYFLLGMFYKMLILMSQYKSCAAISPP